MGWGIRRCTVKKPKVRNSIFALKNYIAFFLAISFTVTCSFLLYLETVTTSSGIEFARENIELAAKITFLNIFLLSFICTLLYMVIRTIKIRKPIESILSAVDSMSKGDFTIRIPEGKADKETEFDIISRDINKLAKELGSIETLRTDFVSNVSHEIKTPLSVIQNYATLLSQKDLSEQERQEYCSVISRSTRQLANLISDILQLNRLENQEIFPRLKQYELNEQLCECLLRFEPLWEEKGIVIHTELDRIVYIESDRNLLDIVWTNLISNALKFTPRGGAVSILLKESGQTISVSVIDSGCGIDKEDGDHIFEKFYQGDSSHRKEGNGLGLALVKRIVDILHAGITVKSMQGQGSEFTVILPH